MQFAYAFCVYINAINPSNNTFKVRHNNPFEISYGYKWKSHMVKKNKQKLTLDRPANYQIKISGLLKKGRIDWDGMMSV